MFWIGKGEQQWHNRQSASSEQDDVQSATPQWGGWDRYHGRKATSRGAHRGDYQARVKIICRGERGSSLLDLTASALSWNAHRTDRPVSLRGLLSAEQAALVNPL